MRHLPLACVALLGLGGVAAAQETRIVVQTTRPRQVFQGLGAGATFYEGHITSLAASGNAKRQEQFYDDLFTRVPTRYLQVMIRETHEPTNDNADPFTPAFKDRDFEYCKHTLAIVKAARKRRKDIQLLATLYTPPPWMKTNNAAGGGGEARATLKRGLELELGEYLWAYLDHMHRNGATIQYLSIANEPDWPHTQPGYFLSGEQNAALFKKVADYLDRMAKKFPKVPRPKLVGPNTLSAPGAAKDYVPRLLLTAGRQLDVVASHDYDPRGDRWAALRKLAGKRPLWMTEWCFQKKDASPGMIVSAVAYGQALHEAFRGGANVWLAYAWVYPPRDSGEALIHVDWGKDYRLLKAYHVFRQWAGPLVPGMRVVDVGITGAGATGEGKEGVKPTAFLSTDNRTLIVHVVNTLQRDAPISLRLTGKWAAVSTAARTRTSETEDVAELPALKKGPRGFADTLPGRSMISYRFSAR